VAEGADPVLNCGFRFSGPVFWTIRSARFCLW